MCYLHSLTCSLCYVLSSLKLLSFRSDKIFYKTNRDTPPNYFRFMMGLVPIKVCDALLCAMDIACTLKKIRQICNTYRIPNSDTFSKNIYMVHDGYHINKSLRCIIPVCDGYCLYFEKISQICNTHHEPNNDTNPTYSVPTKHSIHYEFNIS